MKSSSVQVLLHALVGLLIFNAVQTSAQVTWRRTYGGYGTETATGIRETSDGGYIIVGTCGSFGNGASDIYLLKVDADGEPQWSRTYGTLGVENGVGCQVLDDGFVIAGSTSLGENGGYDMVLIRTDPEGLPLWERHYGTADWDLCNAVELMSDGFLLGGVSYGTGSLVGQAYMVRTDFDGAIQWSATSGGAAAVECFALAVDADDGFAVAGGATGMDGDEDGYIAKFDAAGEEVWSYEIGGDSADRFTGVVFAPDGGVIVNGRSHSQASFEQIFVVGLSGDGAVGWEVYLGNTSDARGSGIANAHGTGYVITGLNTLNLGEPDMIFTMLGAGGWFVSGNNYGNGNPAVGNAIIATTDGGYAIAGWSENYGPGNRSCYVVKVDGAGQTDELTVETYFDPVSATSLERADIGILFPNPVQPHGTVTIPGYGLGHSTYSIVDAQGQLVAQGTVGPDGRIAVGLVSSGMYSLAVSSANGLPTRYRMVVADPR